MLIGRHISLIIGYANIPELANDIGSNITQIFIGDPQTLSLKLPDKEQLELFKKRLNKYNIRLVIHGNYAINLAQPNYTHIKKSSQNILIKSLNFTNDLNCLGVIIHMGKNVLKLEKKLALDNYIEGLNYVINKSLGTIILETGASVGNEVGSNLDDLAYIYDNIIDKSRIKFCIDTCHIWASGYDISDRDKVLRFFEIFNNKFGKNKIALFHLNDSLNPLNSHIDRHADLGFGYIPVPGLQTVVQYAFINGIDIITETPLIAINPISNLEVTFKNEKDLIKKWTGN